MNILTHVGGFVGTNGYLVEAPHGWLAIDAPKDLPEFAAGHELEITHTLLTHQHFDHVESAHLLPDIHAWSSCDRTLIMDQEFREKWHLPVFVEDFTVSTILQDVPVLELAGLQFQLLHVPGHSPDSVAFYLPDDGLLFGGDTLFAEGIGRTDLPGGDEQQLQESITQKLLPLPDDTRVFPGHGPETTIGHERTNNPFLHRS